VISLGLRLAVNGGREAITRLALIAVAVAIGAALLLATLAGINAVNSQNARYAWLETGASDSNAPALTTSPARTDALWWLLRADYFHGDIIGRVDLAATGPTSPLPPGVAKLPGPGQFYASPALTKLLNSTPAPQLGDRFPGTQIGTIGDAALPAPDSLLIVIGRSAADLASTPGAIEVTRISTTPPSNCNGPDCALGVGIDSNGIILILSVVIAALFFPVLIFIGGATRLSAARREQRFAAMRLVGATPRQISVIATVESSVAATAGVAAGFALFYLLRPSLAGIPFTGIPFFVGDLSLSLLDALLVAVGIPLAAAITARVALRRVQISPLGVTRRVTPAPPRIWRVIPLLAGMIELGYFAYVRDIGAKTHTNTTVEAIVFLIGILLVMAGLVIAGPWLTMIISRLVATRARRPAALIAGRRLADNPKAGFRAISGLVLAVFVGTCALGVITTIVAYTGGTAGASADSTGTLVAQLAVGPPSASAVTSIPAATMSRLITVPGVTGVAKIRATGYAGPPPSAVDRRTRVTGRTVVNAFPMEVVSCAQLVGVPALGRCPPGVETVAISPDFGGSVADRPSMPSTTWPAAGLSTAQLQNLPVDTVVVGTDGSRAAVERARTILDLALPVAITPQTISEIQSNNSKQLDSYRQLANVVILTSLPIAGCSLAVNVAGGLAERKRPFSLLRLAGVPLRVLQRVITLEAAAPLLITAVVSAGAGLLAAQLFLRAQLGETLQPPTAEYYSLVLAGLIASLAIIGSTLPLLKRITGPETARNE
jgi:hypothetical protein